jgi:hypothetical protein
MGSTDHWQWLLRGVVTQYSCQAVKGRSRSRVMTSRRSNASQQSGMVRPSVGKNHRETLRRAVSLDGFTSHRAFVEKLICDYARRRKARTQRADHLPLAVQVALPRDIEALVEKYIDERASEVWTTVIHGALYYMRALQLGPDEAREDFARELRRPLHPREKGRVADARFWRELRTRVKRRHAVAKAAAARGELGNLLLPDELFEFVTVEMLSGRFETPTAVVSAAMRKLDAYVRRKRRLPWGDAGEQQPNSEAPGRLPG